MKSMITQEIVDKFNNILIAENSIVRLNMKGYTIYIGLLEDKYLEYNSLGLTKQFYDKLQQFFRERGVWDLSFNNTRSCFWKLKCECQ